jgi:hypothetical protein
MIATAIISIIYTFILFMVSVLPISTGLSTDVTSAVSNVFDIAYSFDYIIPMDTVLNVLLIAVGFHAGVLAFKGVEWILRKIPGIN